MSDGPVGVIFEVSEESVITGVDFRFMRLVRWREPVVTPDGTRVAIPREGRKIEDQTIDLLEPKEQLIQGVRADSASTVYGTRTITYELPGQLMLSPDDGDTIVALDLVQYVQDAGDVIIDRRGWGVVKAEIEVLDTIAGEPGDYLDTTLTHQVNALVGQSPVAQRGGTRTWLIVGRTPKAGTATLQLEDAGNLAQTAPETPEPPATGTVPVPEFTLAADDDEPLTVATATVTNDTDLEDFGAVVEWEYAVSVTEPVTAGTPFGPLALGFGVDEIDTPEVPTGSTVWVRARANVISTGERSDWSDWESITLGPDDDGTGGTLAPFLLALELDSGGVLSASATSLVAAITTVYFVAGVAGGAPPAYADVLLGTTDSSGPPFTAAALATMAEGEVRTVGAIGEDALGNRTVLILASITRAVDTGAGAGTPGNWSHAFVTEAGGTFVLGAHGDAAEALGTGKYRRTLLPGSFVRGQATVDVAGTLTAYLDCRVSLDDGATWETDLLGLRVPLRDVKHAVGFAIEVPEDFEGDVLLDAVVAGGDDDATPEILNFVIESTSSEPPPADGEDEPLTPAIPQQGNLVAEWYETEGSGTSVANKTSGSGGTPALTLGSSDAGANPTWRTGPRRINVPAHASFHHTFLMTDDIPTSLVDVSLGFAVFFPIKMISGGAGAFICGFQHSVITGGYASSHYIDYSSTAIEVTVVEAASSTAKTALYTGGGLPDGDWHLVGFVHTGATLKMVYDGAVVASVACGAARLDPAVGGRVFHLGWKGTNLSFAVGPGDCDIGDPIAYATPGIDFTDDELLALYLQYRTIYTALPSL